MVKARAAWGAALRRPYTFIVLAMFIVLMGVTTILRMPADMFPQIDIPVAAAIWGYTGLPPSEMEGRITSQFERAATTSNTVDVVAGLSGGEQVIMTPPSDVRDGMEVQPVSAK